MGIEFGRDDRGQINFYNLVPSEGGVLTQFSKDEKGQYHFFHIVHDNGAFKPWYGYLETPEQQRRRFHAAEPERLTIEDFVTRYNIPIEHIDPGNSFMTLGSPNQYPSGEFVQFVDKDTGYTMTEIYFEELNPDSFFFYKTKEDRKYRPSNLTHFSYEPKTMEHPVLGERVDGVHIIMKSWVIDRKFRRRERENPHSIFVVFEDEWDPDSGEARRWNRLFVESEFIEEGESEGFSVNRPVTFIEQYRAFHFPGQMFMYVTVGDPPKLVFSPGRVIDLNEEQHPPDFSFKEKNLYKVGDRFVAKENIPQEIGEPRRITF
jgi:hypothetical protein